MKTTDTRQGLRPYQPPTLVVFGDVRRLTQGGTGVDTEVMNNNSNFMP